MTVKQTTIYKITNTINNKCYIGSSINVTERLRTHLYKLNNNNHTNQHLQNAYNKYKKENFVFEIVVYCSKRSITFLEKKYIKKYKTLNKKYGYNKRPATGNYFIDNNSSNVAETKQKMSDNRANVSGKNNPMYGKQLSKETKQRMSDNHVLRLGKK